MKLKSIIKSGLICGVFAFLICACESGSVTGSSNSVAPGVPAGIAASQGTLEDGVTVEWDAVSGAEYYVIYKAIDTPESFKVIATRVVEPAYTDTPVSSGRTCYYRVAAGCGTKWSDPSAEAMGFALKGTPMPPESVSIPVSQIDQVTLTWDAVTNADSYNIYRCDVKYGEYTKINTEDVTATTFTDIDTVADKKYYYKIVPVNAHGEGAASVIISGAALQKAPVWTGSVNLTATDNEYGEKVVIEWAAAQDAAAYTVLRAPDVEGAAGEFAVIAENVTDLLFADRDTTLTSLTLYHYKVVAVSSGGQTDCGTETTGSVDRSIPALVDPPATVTASTNKVNVITVSWGFVAACNDGYTVYRSTSSSFTSPVVVANKISELTFDDTSIAPVSERVTYYYRVTAWARAGEKESESLMSTVTATGRANPDAPGIPVNLVSSMNYTEGTLTVSWTAADAWTKTYNVYRSDNGIDGDYTLMSANQAGTSYTDSIYDEDAPIQAGVVYFYKVEAINSVTVKSSQSDGLSGVFTLRVPTNLDVSTKYNINTSYTYTVTWTAVNGATGYEVGFYHGSPKVWDNVTVTGGATTTLTWTSPTWGGAGYNVRIRAINATPDPDIYSAYSAEVN